MKKSLIFWTPRILGILFALFLALFAFDVFGEGYGFWGTMVAFLIHLLPTFLVLVAVAVAWRWEWVGTVLFFGLGVGYIVMAWGKFEWVTYLTISGPLFLVGLLFLVNRLYRAEM